jgi:hypothetical protein
MKFVEFVHAMQGSVFKIILSVVCFFLVLAKNPECTSAFWKHNLFAGSLNL